jgi:GTPase
MLPVIVLVGRPNVGKSTLFNRLTRSRAALVANQPGLTRDRQYGVGRQGERAYVAVDTGGLSGDDSGLSGLLARQVWLAIDEADHILFLLDAREGMSATDQAIAEQLRRSGKPITPVVNKSESLAPELAAVEFHRLGLGDPVAIAAAHGMGVNALMDEVLAGLPESAATTEAANASSNKGLQIAVVGRPNVGKSTLVNRLLGEERVLTYDEPGTTRDSIFIPFVHAGRDYTLIDTAGVRRRAKVQDTIEKFSVIKTLQAIEGAQVVLLVVDAQQGIGEQDATLAGHVLESGRALVLAINKWDGLDPERRERVRDDIERNLAFLDFAPRHFISALHGSGVGHLLAAVDEVFANATRKLSTPELTRILEAAVSQHAPPLVQGRRIKLRYAHQGGRNPPIIVIHGNQTDAVPEAYKRYLNHQYRRLLHLQGTPLRLEFRTGNNPFEGRHNPLTPGQVRKRRRMFEHVKRSH